MQIIMQISLCTFTANQHTIVHLVDPVRKDVWYHPNCAWNGVPKLDKQKLPAEHKVKFRPVGNFGSGRP